MSTTSLERNPPPDDAVAVPEEVVNDSVGLPQEANAGRLYPVVWRWHFYAGLLIAPILWIITITGAIYVFRTELTAWRDHSLQIVSPMSERMSYDALYEIAARRASPHEIEAIVVQSDPARSVRFVAHAAEGGDRNPEQRHQSIYINPYTGGVLGTPVAEEDFFATVLELHRSLMLGSTGRVLSELATCWALILLGTGVFLWWPRGKKNVAVWVPRVRGNFYAVLRDWHAVSGIYLVPITALIAVTGLFFTLVMGTAFNTTVQKLGHWPPEWFGSSDSVPLVPNAVPASLDQIVATALKYDRPDDVVSIRLADSPNVAHKAWLMRDEDKNSLRMVDIDRYTAEPLMVVDATEVPFLYRVRLWAVSIHMGQIFGTPTKILALVSTLGLFGLSVTGIWMWWRRRPTGRTGFLRRPPTRSLPAWGWVIVILTGILLPVAGASIILIGLCDLLIYRRQSRRPVAATPSH